MLKVPLAFNLEKDPYCCGIFLLGNFASKQTGYSIYGSKEKPKEYESYEEIFKIFEYDLANELADHIQEDAGYTGEYIIYCSLVSKYRHENESLNLGQLSKFRNYLEESGWKIMHTFVNANSGNTVNHYSRVITKEEVDSLRSD